MEAEEKIAKLQEIIDGSDNIVFFGGAGVSTESGIPDFRSVDGLYNQEYDYPPETIISHSFFLRRPEEFYRFYRNRMIYPNAEPNITHKVLAELEKKGKLKAVITQNIDGLHQLAGSQEVIELHGSVLRNYCMNCGKFHVLSDIMTGEEIPKCECGGVIKPDVVLYEEQLDEVAIEKTIKYIEEADTLIVAGTSLSVYPAAGFIRAFKGRNLVLINKSSTSYDSDADLLIQAGLGQVLGKIRV
ncbi:MAG: NAD-dependent protein deacylase [Lachnospiraceae bacterium]|nr:NAD-dependent protein deacylase [Lachnospiraceae bacterium]